MKIISHRGNLNGPNPQFENCPMYLQKTYNLGFDIEIDVWSIGGKYFLGHDEPVYYVEDAFLENSQLWCHAKNLEALDRMIDNNLIKYFWHQNDDFTLTSNCYIWTYPGKEICKNSIIVDLSPDWSLKNYQCFGVCTDYILK
jgi:hypothetical protein